MKSISGYIFLVAALSALALSTCGCGSSAKVADEPYFQTRGVVVAWDDVCDTASIDWVKLIKENGLNTISVCGHDYQSPEYLAFKQRCADNGIYFEYEDHMDKRGDGVQFRDHRPCAFLRVSGELSALQESGRRRKLLHRSLRDAFPDDLDSGNQSAEGQGMADDKDFLA